MNNLAVGGFDRRRGRAFSYYETVAGGAGAGPHGRAGASGVHTHMTNTLNTPIEALEAYYPFLVTAYGLRRAAVGAGGIAAATVSCASSSSWKPPTSRLLTDRRRLPPWGLAGGAGRPRRAKLAGSGDRTRRRLPSKINFRVEAGDAIRIETPGGGGWGRRGGGDKNKRGRRSAETPAFPAVVRRSCSPAVALSSDQSPS